MKLATTKQHREAAPLIDEHTKLMDELPYPHAGWVKCRCELARKIRKTLNIGEPLPRGTSRVRLGLEEFEALVQGRIVVKERVMFILEDIGFDKMLEAVVLASRANGPPVTE